SFVLFFFFFFFFSSRRRHTRFSRDWSSDVCSSDLDCFEFLHALPPSMEELDFPGMAQERPESGRNARCNSNARETPASQQKFCKIGRASCREREKISVVAESLEKINKVEMKEKHDG